ncbi:helix-turn-helix DNA binding protein [Gordonia phage Bibwit]|uniref:Helix-turn-helix DNA binding protein n=3 Tax=Schenleyvirinae TaxID=3424859 RepID=A0A385DUA9_9CAUD|nr:helix-turn-helix DNA binding protein [Gordonia phage Ashertheman]YP_010001931.1 helix-turn-helix DNA binding protein [Gordonia phage Gaea]YP_010099213.1 helix-turn-helix DNA binding protein [Gordonia phage Bibwit]AXQ62961.1 helix-turn-helix DNA binding protein [Gordonia phage Ashertheman]AYR02606.1 helix-turn-helix DNA binding protein [Gordonia phage Bibwit]AYR02861.1 helix-turn-helix DNA binding protein [Gordonia phage Gaea]
MNTSEHARSRLRDYRGAAEYLGVSYSTVRRLIARGDLHVVMIGNSPRLDLADLDAYIEQRKVIAG